MENRILDHISKAQSRVSFRRLHTHFSSQNKRSVKKAVSNLVLSGLLRYTYELGNSYLTASIDLPIAVSERVVLKPPTAAYDAEPDQVVVDLERGGAFGLGDHPTTRLAIQLMDKLLIACPSQQANVSLSALDIGTGSGVLAIVAAKLGIDAVLAVDTDPCAVFEARSNVRINGLENQIQVCQESDAFENKKFDLILANLRTPTLLDLVAPVGKMAASNCRLVFSGIRVEEARQIRILYEHAGFRRVQMRSEKGWCGISLTRGDFSALTSGSDVKY